MYAFLSEWQAKIYPEFHAHIHGKFTVTVNFKGDTGTTFFAFNLRDEQKAFLEGMEAIDPMNELHTVTEIVP